ncbi:MAG TPA: family 1 glycosylhydrolase, partial [Ktedonobacteraceae bacterium]|nr:family 1 glycosylhydrolase [Ktedonobacteraceae bacterium]
LDDFEWTEGWNAHLGLAAMNPLTQKRTPRTSFSLYSEICRANAITEEIVERYAPKAIDRIFKQS